ncbi:MAG TPA: hypothetical protein VH518_12740 [Tepidisphaeraceae bacterium]|jgi:hypothetical protein
MNTTNQTPTPRSALTTLRIIWAALLMGQIIFLLVILTMRSSGTSPRPVEGTRMLAYIAIGMVVVMAPAAFVLRGVLYGPRDSRGYIAPQKYTAGNVIFFALLEGASFMGLVAFLLGDPLGLLASAVAMAIQAVNFPTGSLLDLEG